MQGPGQDTIYFNVDFFLGFLLRVDEQGGAGGGVEAGALHSALGHARRQALLLPTGAGGEEVVQEEGAMMLFFTPLQERIALIKKGTNYTLQHFAEVEVEVGINLTDEL